MTSTEFKEKIKQYNYIVKGIKDLKSRIREIEESSPIVKDSVRGSSKEFPYTEHTCVVEGREENSNLKRKKKLLKVRLKELEKLKDELDTYIRKIDNEKIKQILEYKYIYEYSWIKIADKFGGVTPDSLRMEVKRFLEKV